MNAEAKVCIVYPAIGCAFFNNISNKEWIWGSPQTLSQSDASYNFYYLDATYVGAYSSFMADPHLMDTFVKGDIRLPLFQWMREGYLGYKKFHMRSDDTADLVLMRSAEMYLIEAEAKVRDGVALDQAVAPLNTLRTARGVGNYDVTGKICPNPYVYNEGKEDYTQVFAQMTQKDGSFLVSKEKTDNFSWQDLKGKTVIPGRKGGVPYMTFEYVLKQNGLDPKKDLVLDDSIKFDLMAGAFAGGNAEYVTLFEPTASATEKAGKGYIVASVGEASGEIPYTAYFAKKSYIEKNPNIIQGFTNAIYKGEQWVKSHSAKEIAEAIVDFFPDTDLSMLEAALQSYIDIDAWRDNPVLKQESFALLQKVMKEAGELEKEADYGKVINNSFAEKAIQKLGK